MLLVLVRHALAEERDSSRWPDDSLRPLTRRGRRRFTQQAAALGGGVRRVDCLLSSGYERAWATAKLLARHAGTPKPRRETSLEGERIEDAFEAIRREAARLGDDAVLALVGHEPMLSHLAAHLLAPTRSSDASVASPVKLTPSEPRPVKLRPVKPRPVKLRKGAMLGLRLGRSLEPGDATLLWLLDPRFTRPT